jgi:hypothetical protein
MFKNVKNAKNATLYKIHKSTLCKGGSCISGVMGTDKILGKLKFTFFGLLKHVARCCSQYKLYDMTNQLG